MQEVRDTSLVVLWEPPLFDGRSPVNGYYLDFKEASAGDDGWKGAHEKANKKQYIKVRTRLCVFCMKTLSIRQKVLMFLIPDVFFR